MLHEYVKEIQLLCGDLPFDLILWFYEMVRWRVEISIWIVWLHLTTLLKIVWLKNISLLVLVNICRMKNAVWLYFDSSLCFDVWYLSIDCVCVSFFYLYSALLLRIKRYKIVTIMPGNTILQCGEWRPVLRILTQREPDYHRHQHLMISSVAHVPPFHCNCAA